MIRPTLLKLAKHATRPAYARFQRALHQPEQTQQRVLDRLLRLYQSTERGRNLAITDRDDYAAFQRKVPLVNYDELRPWIERQKQTRAPILTPEPPRCFERTSGSTGRPKLIPYTRVMQSMYGEMLAVWAHDILRHGPRLRTGLLYAAMSPDFGTPAPADGLYPIGMASDHSYVEGLQRRLLDAFAPQFPHLKGLLNQDEFLWHTALVLLSHDWEILSVWSPTHLDSALRFITTHWSDLSMALLTRDLPAALHHLRHGQKRRKVYLQSTFEPEVLWPNLRLISCWTVGAAAPVVERLQAVFPHVWIQPKGLMATEGPMTLPLVGQDAAAPLLHQVFFEFLSDEGQTFRLHEIEPERTYELVMSHGSGLLRYRTGDRVQRKETLCSTPLLEFLGRRDTVDLVGEKLGEEAVLCALHKSGVPANDTVLIPTYDGAGAHHYTLVTTRPVSAGEELDRALADSFQYAVARRQGQLQSARAMCCDDIHAFRHRLAKASAMNLGSVKPGVLWRQPLSSETLEKLLS